MVSDPNREAGFTMVELVMALTVMSIGVVGAMSVFNSSFAVAAQASIRSRAVALATSEIEAYRAVPYAEVAVDPVVSVETRQDRGVAFTVERGVTAADGASILAAYKQATISVSWRDHSGPHAVVQTTLLYPGGLGPHVDAVPPPPPPAAGTPPPPPAASAVSATPVVDVGGSEPAFDLAWSIVDESNLAGFSVRYTTGSDNVIVTESLPPGSRAFRVAGLSSATTYTFEVGSRPTSGATWVWTAADPVTTASAATTACAIGAPAIDPAQVRRRPPGQGGTLLENPTFSVNSSGSCHGLRIAYRPTKSGAVVSKHVGGSSGLRTRTLEDTTAKWDSGTHLIELYDDADVLRATVKLLVCDSASACR